MICDLLVKAAKHDPLGAAVLVANIAGIVVLIFYTFYARQQAKFTAGALEKTAESNAATKESNEIAQQNLELGNRAWLAITGIEGCECSLTGPMGVKVPTVGVKVSVKNIGRTPATSAVARFCITVAGRPILPVTQQFFTRAATIDSLIIGPGATTGYSEPLPDFLSIGAAQLKAGPSGDIPLLVRCEITYTDYFGKKRETSMAWENADLSPRWVAVTKDSRMD